jgi:hypothetical protein
VLRLIRVYVDWDVLRPAGFGWLRERAVSPRSRQQLIDVRSKRDADVSRRVVREWNSAVTITLSAAPDRLDPELVHERLGDAAAL